MVGAAKEEPCMKNNVSRSKGENGSVGGADWISSEKIGEEQRSARIEPIGGALLGRYRRERASAVSIFFKSRRRGGGCVRL